MTWGIFNQLEGEEMSCSFGVLVCTVSRAEPCLTPELLDRSVLGFALEQMETFSKHNRAAT